MFNCQTKRAIVALFIYPEIPPCRFFFGPGNRIFVCLDDCAIPHNRRFLPHNLPPKTHTILFFFPHLVRRPAQSCSAFVCQFATRCICLCENITFRQIGSHVGAVVQFFGVSSLLSESVHMYIYICGRKKTSKLHFHPDKPVS